MSETKDAEELARLLQILPDAIAVARITATDHPSAIRIARACELLLAERERLAAAERERDELRQRVEQAIASLQPLFSEAMTLPDLIGCTRDLLDDAGREIDALLVRVAELEAVPGGVAVAGLLRAIEAKIQEEERSRVKAAVERRDRVAGEHILRREALSLALDLARAHLAAPTREQQAAAEVLARAPRDATWTALADGLSSEDYLDLADRILRAKGGRFPASLREKMAMGARVLLAGIVACDAKPGGGT